jgi:hypothetical protein
MNLHKAVERMPRTVIVLGAAILSMVLVALLVGTAGAQEQPNGSNGGVPDSTVVSASDADSTVVSASDVTSSSVNNFEKYKTVYNTDFASAGFGGMRDNGTGTINLSGITGTVTQAYLVWQGPTNTSDPLANANVTFAGNSITGENIGFSSPNCWSFSNSQGYRADVTSLVTGNGNYTLKNFVKPSANINGVSLLVFFDDGNQSNNRDVVLFTGNDSNIANSFDANGWNVSLSGINYTSGNAGIQMHVSDGQAFFDDTIRLNNRVLVGASNIFSGDSVPNGPFNASGGLWDIKNFNVTSFLRPGDNTLDLTTGVLGDCLSLVVAAIDLPAGAAPPPDNPDNQPPTADAGGPYEVNEGDSVNVSATGTDPENGALTYAWDLDGDGAFDDASTQSASFTPDDGPSDSRTVEVQVTDDQGATATATAEVKVNNVEPTIQSISASVSQTLTGRSVLFDASTTDPSTADTTTGFTYAWLVDGVDNSITGNPLGQKFRDCGDHSVSATATDKDDGVSASVTSDVVNAYEAHFQPPLDEGMYNTVQKGRVVPVKISIGCDGQNLTDLSPAIQLLKGDAADGTQTDADAIETLSSSAADTTGFMRAVDDGYIYNLQVPGNAVADDLYTIRVRPFGDSNTGASMDVVLKIRK